MMRAAITMFSSMLVWGSVIGFARSQNTAKSPAPCSQDESKQFDFWIGEWDLEWELQGKRGKGTNSIGAILGDCVIEENFDGGSSIPLRGMSFSMFTKSGKWQQTWVDNQGSYLDFVGEFKDDQMVLQRRAKLNGKDIVQRMVWYNISKDKLSWNWERSEDEGKTWTVLWKISYSRRK